MPLVFATPPLSTSSAHLLAFALAATYVGSLYISKNARLSFRPGSTSAPTAQKRPQYSNERWRDDPPVIRARLLAVSVATVVCCAGVLGVVWWFIGVEEEQSFQLALETTLARLGLSDSLLILFLLARSTYLKSSVLSFSSLLSSLILLIQSTAAWLSSFTWPALFAYLTSFEDLEWVYPHLITPLLFLGPLYAHWLFRTLPFQRNWAWDRDLWRVVFSWVGVRNYFLAPLTEEVVFRSCILSIYSMAGASRTFMITFAPAWFGLAHIHHAWDTYNRYGKTPSALKRALLTSAFQLTYTTLFGAYASYLFLRTSTLAPVVSAHIFCNIMGVPTIGEEIRMAPHRKWHIVIAYVLGIVLFAVALGPLTRTFGGLYWREGGVGVAKNY